MSIRVTLATATRILRQLRRDHRTVAMVLALPPALLVLFRYVFGDSLLFYAIGPALVGLFPFVIMFIITSIAMLRERTGGTLERLMSLPIAKIDLLAGYGLAFALVAAAQAAATAAVAFGFLDLTTQSPVWEVAALAIGNAVLGMALGLFFSAFATSEFQAVQFMPAVVFPQLLLGGLFVPRDEMARLLELISNVLPLTYSYDALVRVTHGDTGSDLVTDVAVIVGVTILALLLGAATLRRRTA